VASLARVRPSAATSAPLSIVISDAEGNQIPHGDPDFGEKLSKLLGREVRLIDVRPAGIELNRARPDEVMTQGLDATVTHDVLAIAGAAPIGGFFDFAPLHLMTTASLDVIRAAAPDASIEADRYWPNLVIETPPLMAFAESHWIGRQIRIGDSARIEVIAPTPRRAVPMLVHGSLPGGAGLNWLGGQTNAPTMDQKNGPLTRFAVQPSGK